MTNSSVNRICLVALIIVVGLFSSCIVSDDLNSGRLLQKRKYLKGYHIASKPQHTESNSSTTRSTDPISKSYIGKSIPCNSDSNHAVITISTDSLVIVATETLSADTFSKGANESSRPLSVAAQKDSEEQDVLIDSAESEAAEYFILLSFLTGGIALAFAMKRFFSASIRVSQWASNNKYKSQLLVYMLTVINLFAAILLGKILGTIGVDLTARADVLSGILLLGGILLHLHSSNNPLSGFLRRKICYIALALSLVTGACSIGNRLYHHDEQVSVYGGALKYLGDPTMDLIPATNYSPANPDGSDVALVIFIIFGILALVGVIALCICAMSCGAATTGASALLVIGILFLVMLSVGLYYLVKKWKRAKLERDKSGGGTSESNVQTVI